MTHRINKAKKHLARIRELTSRVKSSILTKAKESEIIANIRKDRESIWGAKIAARP